MALVEGLRIEEQPGKELKELQQFLGHKSITSTQIYTTLDDEHLSNVAKETEIEY